MNKTTKIVALLVIVGVVAVATVAGVVVTVARRSRSTEPKGLIFIKPEFVELASLNRKLKEKIVGRELSYHDPILKSRLVEGTDLLKGFTFRFKPNRRYFNNGVYESISVDVYRSGETDETLFGMLYYLPGRFFAPDEIEFVRFYRVEGRPFNDEQIKQVLDLYISCLQENVR